MLALKLGVFFTDIVIFVEGSSLPSNDNFNVAHRLVFPREYPAFKR
jgi:hypothetical protein